MSENSSAKKRTSRTVILFSAIFAVLIVWLLVHTAMTGNTQLSSPENPRNYETKSIEKAGTIFDRNGMVLACTEDGSRRYAADEAARTAVSHVVGDVYGMSVGAETLQAALLRENKGKDAQDVHLTIDAGLCRSIYNKMESNGAVVVMNYDTGEVLASVSKPGFNAELIPDGTVAEKDAVWLDRATQGLYPPGSILKVMTAKAAIENDMADFETECNGLTAIDGVRITCRGHKSEYLSTALSNSCNIYFGTLAAELGPDLMMQAATDCLFNTTLDISDFTLTPSQFRTGQNRGELAWAGIGQHEDLITPMHAAMLAAAIGNRGTLNEPRLLLSTGDETPTHTRPRILAQIMAPETADMIADLMQGSAEHGEAKLCAIEEATLCGKTGTAEYEVSDDSENHNDAWFIGFAREYPIAVAVVLEDAVSGLKSAAPLAAEAVRQAIGIYA